MCHTHLEILTHTFSIKLDKYTRGLGPHVKQVFDSDFNLRILTLISPFERRMDFRVLNQDSRIRPYPHPQDNRYLENDEAEAKISVFREANFGRNWIFNTPVVVSMLRQPSWHHFDIIVNVSSSWDSFPWWSTPSTDDDVLNLWRLDAPPEDVYADSVYILIFCAENHTESNIIKSVLFLPGTLWYPPDQGWLAWRSTAWLQLLDEEPTIQDSVKELVSCCHAHCSCSAPEVPEDLKCLEESVGSWIRPDVWAWPDCHGCIPASLHNICPPCFHLVLSSEARTHSPAASYPHLFTDK